MKLLRSQSGMSLIEIMMAVGILSAISVSVVMLSKNMDKSVKSAELKQDIEGVTREIAQLMNQKESCTATVWNALGSANSVTYLSSIKLLNTRNQIEAHPRLKVSTTASPSWVGAGIIINGMYLRHLADTANGANYELRVTFLKSVKAAQGNTRVKDTFFGQNAETRKIPLQLDNCRRFMAIEPLNETAPVSAYSGAAARCTSAGGTIVGNVVTINSGTTLPNRFEMVGCRVCYDPSSSLPRSRIRSCI